MKGIILKDLYENFRIFKNGVSYLAAVLFLFLLIEAMQTGDLFSLKYFFMLLYADYCFCVSAFRLLLY